jgi:hypothetical protein
MKKRRRPRHRRLEAKRRRQPAAWELAPTMARVGTPFGLERDGHLAALAETAIAASEAARNIAPRVMEGIQAQGARRCQQEA